MPLIDVTYPQGALTDAARDALVEALTVAVMNAEDLPDAPFFRGVTWACAHEQPSGTYYAGGQPIDRPLFRVEARVLAGAVTADRKQTLVEAATLAVIEHSELGADDAPRVMVVLDEVTDGNWGAAGGIVTAEALAGAIAAHRAQEAAAS